jgi:hypothetical protein
MQQYKLSIAEKIGVKVKGTTVGEDGGEVPYAFTLICTRLAHDDLRAAIEDKTKTANQFFEEHAKDWRGQNLVHDAAGRPAPFSGEALGVLFTVAGMAAACWQAYLQQVMATTKN